MTHKLGDDDCGNCPALTRGRSIHGSKNSTGCTGNRMPLPKPSGQGSMCESTKNQGRSVQADPNRRLLDLIIDPTSSEESARPNAMDDYRHYTVYLRRDGDLLEPPYIR